MKRQNDKFDGEDGKSHVVVTQKKATVNTVAGSIVVVGVCSTTMPFLCSNDIIKYFVVEINILTLASSLGMPHRCSDVDCGTSAAGFRNLHLPVKKTELPFKNNCRRHVKYSALRSARGAVGTTSAM